MFAQAMPTLGKQKSKNASIKKAQPITLGCAFF